MTDFSRKQSPEKPIDVLLVEDNPGDVRLTREAFETTDTETTLHHVTDGDAALDYLSVGDTADSGSAPDLVLLDLDLPGTDGYEILEAIREDARLQYLPVIVLTSSDADEDVSRCYRANANAYVTKPTDCDEFTRMVEAFDQFWFQQVRLPPSSS